MKKLLYLIMITISFIVVISCENDSTIDEMNDTQNSVLETSQNNLMMKSGAPAPGENSIAEIAISAGFNELVNALVYVDTDLNAGLVDLFLNGKDKFTVFAPTDQAFFDLYQAQGITSINDLPANVVLDVLLYHVTDGRRASNSVVPKNNNRTIETLQGGTFQVDSSGMITATGNTAMITTADISASNGIIHVIDAVILPFN